MKRLLLCSLVLAALSACNSSTRRMPSGPNPVVEIETSKGKITVELYADRSPVSVDNFLAYVDQKFYDGTIFHRVIPDFMIQGGGFEADLRKGEKPTLRPIKNESKNGLKNERGTLAMARTDNPDSATSQFFINVKDNPFLDGTPIRPGYAVFGAVTDGMDVVDAIRTVETHEAHFMKDVPVVPVIITSVRRVEAKKQVEEKK